ncbi:unnamed protein product [Prorocentrum cordatum]|uniref:Uncharacterized protein n=1 Tax=Prorocentrum cordatum TaxID=2364126 RepID=A0ABN9VEJ0_9DINO|nr:unnamed protein product [Polarella glacialis]
MTTPRTRGPPTRGRHRPRRTWLRASGRASTLSAAAPTMASQSVSRFVTVVHGERFVEICSMQVNHRPIEFERTAHQGRPRRRRRRRREEEAEAMHRRRPADLATLRACTRTRRWRTAGATRGRETL